MYRHHYRANNHADIFGVVVENDARFNIGEDEGQASPSGYARFFSRINRPGAVRALHGAHAIDTDFAQFISGRGIASDHRPIDVDSPYLLSFFSIPKNAALGVRTGSYNAKHLRISNPYGGVRRSSSVNMEFAGHAGSPYLDALTIDAIGADFADRVRAANYPDADTRYLGHIPFTAIAEIQEGTGSDVANGQEIVDRFYNPTNTPPLAWVFNNFTIFPYDFPHYGGTDGAPFIHWLLDRVGDMLLNAAAVPEPVTITPDMSPEEIEAANALRVDNTISSLTEWASARDDRAIQVAMQSVAQTQNEIERKLRDLTALRLQSRERMVAVETMRNMATAPSELALISFRRMLESGLITSAMAVPRSTRLVFDTRELVAQDERTGAYHLIGKMRIDIDMGNGAVKFANLDRRITAFAPDMHAPHIWDRGEACLGSFADTIPEFVARADWVGLIEASIQFVESANTRDSAGKYVHRWPFVSDPEQYGLPPYEGVVERFSAF